ncbi:unnamed protein product, partial [Brassica oleracea var. botrytis]
LSSVHCCSTSPIFGTRKTSRSMKFDFKVFTETGLITDGIQQSKR